MHQKLLQSRDVSNHVAAYKPSVTPVPRKSKAHFRLPGMPGTHVVQREHTFIGYTHTHTINFERTDLMTYTKNLDLINLL